MLFCKLKKDKLSKLDIMTEKNENARPTNKANVMKLNSNIAQNYLFKKVLLKVHLVKMIRNEKKSGLTFKHFGLVHPSSHVSNSLVRLFVLVETCL